MKIQGEVITLQIGKRIKSPYTGLSLQLKTNTKGLYLDMYGSVGNKCGTRLCTSPNIQWTEQGFLYYKMQEGQEILDSYILKSLQE